MNVYYTHCIPPTCFGHSCGHLQGGALQRTDRHIETLQKFLNLRTDLKYYILKIIHGLKYILKIKIQIRISVTDANP